MKSEMSNTKEEELPFKPFKSMTSPYTREQLIMINDALNKATEEFITRKFNEEYDLRKNT